MGNNGSNRGNVLNNKRPRSPNDGKRHKESENYWNSKTTSSRDGPLKTSERWRETKEIRYPRHQEKTTVWNRLDDRPTGQDKRKTTVHNPRLRQNSMDRQRGRDLHQSRERHNSHQSQAS
ncbi:BnaC02g33680D [Brassica napus]|uniref:BnaC02g33680D protein n=1 Tax=Brassica napus TaxID=3708 RepID=A0A078HG64_BRANA|nr:BnaC02g33680D [Brassica napus]